MDITIQPRLLRGTVQVPPSKSMAHRLLICAAFAKSPSDLICPQINDDIAATAECLHRICHAVVRTDSGYNICPYRYDTDCGPDRVYLNCHESGATLRFLLPIVGALGIDALFEMEGRLSQRPLSPLWEEMERMGCNLSRPTEHTIRCTGKLRPGHYCMDGSISSQFISGLMLALPLIDGETSLEIIGNVESRPYIQMTRQVLARFEQDCPNRINVEGDWSSGAFWVSATYLGSDGLCIQNLDDDSIQGDRAILEILPLLTKGHCTISASDIPDLIPILSVVAAENQGAVFTDIQRLRYKESDRVASIIAMIESLGGKAEATEDTLTIHGTGLHGGIVNSFSDHRIAMSAAIAATVCNKPVTILDAECVNKSYPNFWDDYQALGGKYAQFLR